MILGFVVFGQSKFEIKSIGSEYSVEQITTAFNNADFCGSHFISKRNRIVLNDGSVVDLKSKDEFISLGIEVAESCFLNDDVTYYNASWSISENGMLMKAFNTELYSSEKEYKHYTTTEEQ